MRKLTLRFIPEMAKELIENAIKELNITDEELDNMFYQDKLYNKICRKAGVSNGDLYSYLKTTRKHKIH